MAPDIIPPWARRYAWDKTGRGVPIYTPCYPGIPFNVGDVVLLTELLTRDGMLPYSPERWRIVERGPTHALGVPLPL